MNTQVDTPFRAKDLAVALISVAPLDCVVSSLSIYLLDEVDVKLPFQWMLSHDFDGLYEGLAALLRMPLIYPLDGVKV